MCGLAGFWQRGAGDVAALRHRVREMAQTLTHRGPDDEGVWVDGAEGLALGFRRLSILDLSPTGHQPMASADGRYVVVFNGEIYNHRELRAELASCGVRFKGTSDTEVLIEGASVWGTAALLPRLWGMFALALWDTRDHILMLARDRLGKKPLYYTVTGNTLLFGSELKALRAHPAFSATLDREAVALYLRYGYVPSPHSIYTGIHKVPPGGFVTIREGRPVTTGLYWDAWRIAAEAQLDPLEIGEEEALQELDVLLKDAVARRMIADVPLGAFLSGGVDSSTIVALMQAQSPAKIQTFTIGFNASGFDEAVAAKAVARHLGTDHQELYVSENELTSVIPRLPQMYDEPLADSSQIPTYLVSKLARQTVTVSLSGDGGDELFGGYSKYDRAEGVWNLLRRVPSAVRRPAARTARALASPAWQGMLGAVTWPVPYQLSKLLESEKLNLLADVWHGNPDALHTHYSSIWRSAGTMVRGARPQPVAAPPPLAALTERMMLRDLVSYLPDDILVKVDRASMAVSLEVRAPLLDHRVVEWVWRLPLSLKRREGQNKWLLRHLLYRYVPQQLVDRPKMGFTVPMGSWLRGPLRAWAESLLNEKRLSEDGLLDPGPVRRTWARHLAGHSGLQDRLWAVLTLQAWLSSSRPS